MYHTPRDTPRRSAMDVTPATGSHSRGPYSSRTRAIDALVARHRVPNALVRGVVDLERENIPMEENPIFVGLEGTKRKLNFQIGSEQGIKEREHELAVMSRTVDRETAALHAKKKQMDAIIRKAKTDNIPGVYKYTGSADPYNMEAQALLAGRDREDQRALVPPNDNRSNKVSD